MARKKKKSEFPGVKMILEEMKPIMDEIQANVSKHAKETELDKDYKLWTIKIIKNIEENDQYDKEAYINLITKYPQIKEVVDDMIEQYQIFSVYDFESNKNNFNLPAYLKKISKMIE